MDEYLTIAATAEGYYTEKRSKFYAFAHPVDDVTQVQELVKQYARPVCSA